jgi:hypothetical protein
MKKYDILMEEKQLARWIYYEEGDIFYCRECIHKRLEEINTSREFSEYINFERGDECGYMEDYADVDYPVYCEKCRQPLYSKFDLQNEKIRYNHSH